MTVINYLIFKMKKIVVLLSIALLNISCEIKINEKAKQSPEMENKEQVEKLSFPMENNFDEKYLLNNFWKCNYDSAGEEFAYSIIIPNYAKPTSVKPTKTIGGLTNIGIYNTIGDQQKYVEAWIGYEKVDKFIQPADWLLSKLDLSGEIILSQNIVTTKNNEKYVDVLTRKQAKNGVVISRFIVLKEDFNYYLSKVSCDKKNYPELAETIQHISHTIRLK
jgi:hypothetical protein